MEDCYPFRVSFERCIKAFGLAVIIYLGLMVYTWVEYKASLSLWQSAACISIFSVILYFSISRDRKREEDFELELGTKQVEIESRRIDAEDFIRNSGDEEAVRVLERARANPYSYVRILSEAKDNGNDTLTVALGILAGMFEHSVSSAVDKGSVAEALNNMESELFGSKFEK